MKTPVSTYRFQIRTSFTLFDAAEQVPYLKDLRVHWVFLSPILTAEKGSEHGYNSTDPSPVDPDRGGPKALQALSKVARKHGMGVLLDIVTNHVGVATPVQNPWWWSLLKEGRKSPYAEAFDVDWDLGGGKVRLPMLGSDNNLDNLEVKDGKLRYYNHRSFRLGKENREGDSLQEVHTRQHYQLMDWRRADAELNYRRFLAVTTLAGIRVEEPSVFEKVHAEVGRWFTEGLVDGFRVDHPDGFADPDRYFRWFKDVSGGAYVLVEKILEPGEVLPQDFACEGTTGYDALADVDRVFVDPAGQQALDALDASLRGTSEPADYAEMIRGTKRMIADGILRSEVLRLARLVPESHGFSVDQAADAIAEIIASFPVYRSYLPVGADVLKEACESAAAHRPDLEVAVGTLQPLLLDPAKPIAIRFQQTSGMVMAKGVEDTAFYRYTRLDTLTEVGAEPTEFAVSPQEFHQRMERRQQELPLSMTTLSTHDTKRSEDARARISVIAELPEEWAETLAELRKLAPIPDGPFENLLWQAIVGAWPASRERLQGYAEKAAREAGNSTKWTDPNEDFESKVQAAVDAVFDDAKVAKVLTDFVARIAAFSAANSVSAKLVQLTMPGVPDVYQGSELWERSLTEPDNRRPLDFGARQEALAKLQPRCLARTRAQKRTKLLVTSRALRLRRDRPELFQGYSPVNASGAAADHLLAFSRGTDADSGALTLATRLPAGLQAGGGWRDTAVDLPTAMRDELTGASYGPGQVSVAEVLGTYPVALLAPVDGEKA
uniref:Maltooligosyl trehalose synthase n=1 Tax=Brevibacterium helvolum TaxID=1704 RepID=O52519_BREHE|nr:maltooligosyl trehalose synthase [Brevibacterium helvolum]